MKVKYDVRAVGGNGLDIRLESLKEAFDLAKKVAAGEGLASLTKITWNEERRIVGYERCFVKADGSFEYI